MPYGEVAEWLNAADSKSVLGQLNGGSNPPLSVVRTSSKLRVLVMYRPFG
jgi:hypothetical protein